MLGVDAVPGEDRITADTQVSTKELACVLGLTGQRIRDMVEDGVLEKVSKGRFLLCDAVQKYIGFKAKTAMTDDEAKLEIGRKAAEMQLKTAKASIAKLEAEELQGNMHRSEDVAAMTEDLIYNIRSALLALPGRLAVNVYQAPTPAEASEIIRLEVHAAMKELSQYEYDPKKYEERVRQRMQWSEEAADRDAE